MSPANRDLLVGLAVSALLITVAVIGWHIFT